jgi:hypothetical protein
VTSVIGKTAVSPAQATARTTRDDRAVRVEPDGSLTGVTATTALPDSLQPR